MPECRSRPYRRILVLLDLDRHDPFLLRRAGQMQSGGVELRLVHIVAPPHGMDGDQYPVLTRQASDRALVDAAQRLLAERLGTLLPAGSAFEVLAGAPDRVVRRLIEDWSADLLMSSRPGRHATSPCDLLTVRAPRSPWVRQASNWLGVRFGAQAG